MIRAETLLMMTTALPEASKKEKVGIKYSVLMTVRQQMTSPNQWIARCGKQRFMVKRLQGSHERRWANLMLVGNENLSLTTCSERFKCGFPSS